MENRKRREAVIAQAKAMAIPNKAIGRKVQRDARRKVHLMLALLANPRSLQSRDIQKFLESVRKISRYATSGQISGETLAPLVNTNRQLKIALQYLKRGDDLKVLKPLKEARQSLKQIYKGLR